MKVIFLILVLFIPLFLRADYAKPRDMSPEDWEFVRPYLLPYEDPLRKKLDRLFSLKPLLEDSSTLSMNHFYFPYWKGKDRIIVAKHAALKDHVFKCFVDSQKIENEWKHFIKRIQGARLTSALIAKRGLESTFKVPKKWLYVIPESAPSRTRFILVAENAHLLTDEKNAKKWKSIKIKESFLKELHDLIDELGLFDSVYIDNIPFCKDDKVAFVDTEHFGQKVVTFWKFEKFLHPNKRTVWKKLYEE